MVQESAGGHESRWAAIFLVSAKIGCADQTLNEWVKKAEADGGKRAGVKTEMAERMKALEKENRELKQAKRFLEKPVLTLPRWSSTADTRYDRLY